MKTYEELMADVRRRKADHWLDRLNAEASGRRAGRRPRDPEKEALLAELDRLRLLKGGRLLDARREPVDGGGA